MFESWFFILLGVGAGLVAHAIYRWWRRKTIPRRRVVEPPNSTFSSPLVRQLDKQEKWASIRLNALHPLNRSEVERLLELVTSGGLNAITERERAFLDYLARPRSKS